MIGHELGGRYQIIERIGGGGMALVYKAHDILLGRNVAIKVLRQQFVHDEEFIRRFRREAQSAASLSHANVVSIYDVGQEDEVHYIVMEYIEGHNLNEIIKERAPLQVDEAVRIASQICDALDHAHQNQIIHRDIKPHNILIGRNGRVKVTDFGIARAVTSTTITQTGSVVGSVHYFSPEHAKGVVTGEKSDLYSLGIVLYQMLTANLPFLGESPISVALKHLQEEFEEPREVNPLIPQSVENVILKSMRKNPQERYQSAKEMLSDLETCLLPERRNEPKMTFDDEEDVEQTRVIPAIKAVQRGSAGNPRSSNEKTANHRSAHASGALFDDGEDEGTEDLKPKNKWKKPVLIISITVLFLALFAGLAWYLNNKLVTPDVVVPNVIKLQEDEARRVLTEAGLDVDSEVVRMFKEGFEEGQVYDQSKLEGAVVKEGTIIQLFVSNAKPLEKMPDVKGKTYEEAYQILIDLGVKDELIKEKSEHSDEAEGSVIAQAPGANSEIDPETAEITLTISKGKDTVIMPDLTNLSQKDAKSKLEEMGLKLDEVLEEPSFTIDAGKVTKQWPHDKDTTVAIGSKVKLFISTGYPPEAINYTFNLPVAPVEEGKNSKVRITYSDARTDGETKDWGTETFKNTKVFSINLVLAPNKEAVVSVYRNGEFMEAYPISYSDAKNGTVKAVELPAQEPVEPENTGEVEAIPGQEQVPDEDENDENNEETPATP